MGSGQRKLSTEELAPPAQVCFRQHLERRIDRLPDVRTMGHYTGSALPIIAIIGALQPTVPVWPLPLPTQPSWIVICSAPEMFSSSPSGIVQPAR
jgi:hypothetical protein